MIFKKILAWALNHKAILYLLLTLPIFITLAYRIINHSLQPLTYSAASRFHLIIIPLAELLFAFFFFDMHQRYRLRTNSPLGWQLVFAFTFVNILVVYFLDQVGDISGIREINPNNDRNLQCYEQISCMSISSV